jgi:uncharacterized OsmC-like protein
MAELSGRLVDGRAEIGTGSRRLALDDPVELMVASLVAGALREAAAYLSAERLPLDQLRVCADYRASDLDPNRLGRVDLSVVSAEELRYEQRAGLAHRVNNYAARAFGMPPVVCVSIAAAARVPA